MATRQHAGAGARAATGPSLSAALIGLAAAAALAACAPMRAEPRVVEAKQPSVTYKYGNDRDLLEAASKARAYCAQYGSAPNMQTTVNQLADGTKEVTFECTKQAAAVVPPPPAPPMQYTYRTDAELLSAVQAADSQCARLGQVAASNVATNADGSKSVTFQCVPR